MATENTQQVDNKASEEIPQTELPKPKTKNPMRIEQGKRLAEWNKQNKRKVPAKMLDEKPERKSDSATLNLQENYWILLGGTVVGIVLFGTLYLTWPKTQKPQVSPPSHVSPPPQMPSHPDPFDMN